MLMKWALSLAVFLPEPSARLALIEEDALWICEVRANCSLLGKLAVVE